MKLKKSMRRYGKNYHQMKTVKIKDYSVIRDFQEINYPNERTAEAQRTQRNKDLRDFYVRWLSVFLFGSP
jgi:hypothetical protein